MTPKQAECLDAIRRLTTPEGVAPSFEELREALGYASTSRIYHLARSLREQGLVTFKDHRARTIKVVEPPRDFGLPLHTLSTSDLLKVQKKVADLLNARREAA